MRKLLSLLLILLPILATAGGPDVGTNDFSGVVLGAGMGYGYTTFTGDPASVDVFIGDAPIFGSTGLITSYNFAANVHIGYGEQWRYFYLGLLAQADFFKAKRTTELLLEADFDQFSTENIFDQLTLSHDIALGIKPGVLLSDNSMLYLNIAGVMGWGKYNTFRSVINLPGSDDLSIGRTTDKKVYGWRLGLGIEERLGAHWSLGLNYLYTQFQKLAVAGSVTGDFTLKFDNHYIPRNNLYYINLNYYPMARLVASTRVIDNDLTGSYVGLLLSFRHNNTYLKSRTNFNFDVTRTGVLYIFSMSKDADLLARAGDIALAMGHAWRFNKFYLGFEANTDAWLQFKTNFAKRSYRFFSPPPGIYASETRVLQRDYFTMNLKPGLYLSDNAVLFFNFGIAYSCFEEMRKDFFGTATLATINFKSKNHFAKVGGRVGLGIEQAVTKHLSVMLQDIYTFYPTVKFNKVFAFELTDFFSLLGADVSSHLHPSNNEVILALLYHY